MLLKPVMSSRKARVDKTGYVSSSACTKHSKVAPSLPQSYPVAGIWNIPSCLTCLVPCWYASLRWVCAWLAVLAGRCKAHVVITKVGGSWIVPWAHKLCIIFDMVVTLVPWIASTGSLSKHRLFIKMTSAHFHRRTTSSASDVASDVTTNSRAASAIECNKGCASYILHSH